MKKLIPILLAALGTVIVSCEKGGDPVGDGRNTGFTVPALTDENSIRLTVDALEGYSVSMVMHGGRIAVDWGDGSSMTKDIHPEVGIPGENESRAEFRHTYKEDGEYTVRIWSEDLTFIYHPGGDAEFGELRMGNCPVLRSVWLYYFPEITTLDMGGCPALEDFHLGYCAKLGSITLDKCPELQTANIFDNPSLAALDVSANGKLTELSCPRNALEELKLPESIEHVNCSDNRLTSFEAENLGNLWAFYCNDNKKLTSLNLAGSDLHVIGFSNTAIETFDFGAFPNLSGIECNNARLGSLDVSSNERLSSLFCVGMGLKSLDLTNNPRLYTLNCEDNLLSSLYISQNPALHFLNVANNRLGKKELDAVFAELPSHTATRLSVVEPQIHAILTIRGNPGSAECNTGLATGKGWHIATP